MLRRLLDNNDPLSNAGGANALAVRRLPDNNDPLSNAGGANTLAQRSTALEMLRRLPGH
jgi:hypothetical protein